MKKVENFLNVSGVKNKNLIRLSRVSLFACAFLSAGFFLNTELLNAQDSMSQDEVKAIIDKALNDPSGKVNVTNNTIEAAKEAVVASEVKPTDQVLIDTIPVSENVSIISPNPRESVLNKNVKFSGKASPGVIVSILIYDEDFNRKFIQHQAVLSFNGNMTADKNGDWVYVPQAQFIPGEYSATASFISTRVGMIQSEKIFFTIIDSNGATSWSIFSQGWIAIAAVVGLLILFIILLLWKRKIVNRKMMVDPTFNLTSIRPSVESEKAVSENSNYPISNRESLEGLDEINKDSLDVEKELVDVFRAVNESMQKVEKLKRNNSDKKQKKGSSKVAEDKLVENINEIEGELVDVSKEVSDVVMKVEDMRIDILEKMKRKK